MGYPFQHQQVVWDAQAVTATAELDNDFKACLAKVIEIVTAGFSGTLDIQGRIQGGVTYDNVNYGRLGVGGPRAVSDQLSWTTDTGRYRYMVAEPYRDMQLVMTRTAGTVSVVVYGWEHGLYVPPVATRRPGGRRHG